MLTFRLTHRRTRALMALAWTAAIALSAWVTAELLTRAIAPARTAASVDQISDPQVAAQRIAGRSLVAASTDRAQAVPPPRTVRQHFALVGVATGFGDAAGFALLRGADGQVVAVQAGETIAPGVTLSAIHADHVELEQDGRHERVHLPAGAERRSPSPTSPNAPTAAFSNPTNQR